MDDRDGVRGIVGCGATIASASVPLIPQNYNSAADAADAADAAPMPKAARVVK